MKALADFAKGSGFFLAAHRGASGTIRENTLPAYEKAVEEGAVMVETDIRLSSDGVPYTYHDDSTIIDGEEFSLAGKGYGEVSEKLGEAPPKLEEIIELIKDRAYLMVEIKSDFSEEAPTKAEKIVKTVSECGYLAHTLFGSFDYRILNHFAQKFTEAHLAAIRLPNDDSSVSSLRQKLNIEAFVCSAEECSEALVRDAKESNVMVGVYGINDRETFERISGLGVKCIVTDYPGRIKELMV